MKKNFIVAEDIPEYDFHSINKWISDTEIIEELGYILDYSKAEHNKFVKIIVGKGKNSPFGPVIKPIVEEELLKLKANGKIKRFDLERTKSGHINEGAFIVEVY